MYFFYIYFLFVFLSFFILFHFFLLLIKKASMNILINWFCDKVWIDFLQPLVYKGNFLLFLFISQSFPGDHLNKFAIKTLEKVPKMMFSPFQIWSHWKIWIKNNTLSVHHVYQRTYLAWGTKYRGFVPVQLMEKSWKHFKDDTNVRLTLLPLFPIHNCTW